jgi:hypothetical protein
MQMKFGQGLGCYQLLANYMPKGKNRLSVNQLVSVADSAVSGVSVRPSEEFCTVVKIVGQKCLVAD